MKNTKGKHNRKFMKKSKKPCIRKITHRIKRRNNMKKPNSYNFINVNINFNKSFNNTNNSITYNENKLNKGGNIDQRPNLEMIIMKMTIWTAKNIHVIADILNYLFAGFYG